MTSVVSFFHRRRALHLMCSLYYRLTLYVYITSYLRFIQCTHKRMHHITQAEYEEFVGIVCSARAAFYLTPGGMVQFNELLQSLRRSKSCKKDLWQRIVNALATGNI